MMKIAIMGTRGIPANYGGFETFAEKLSIGLVEKGHEVTVYCRTSNAVYDSQFYKGVKLIVLPTIRHKYWETVAHTLLSVLHSIFNRYNVVLICNSVNSLFSFVPRLVGQKVALNVDGLEWQRAKWNYIGKLAYKVSEILATLLPNHIVTDCLAIKNYYFKKFKKDSTFIPYGATTQKVTSTEVLKNYDLKSRRYILYVSRLEPENNAHLVVRAFEKTKTRLNLVVVGDAPYNKEYIEELKKTKDKRIIFTGYIFGSGYAELQSHSYFYVQATEVGGTHPALLEGMGFGNCVLATDVPEHREVLGDAGIYFKKDENDLAQKMQYLLDHPNVIGNYSERALKRIEKFYSWDSIIHSYEKLFKKLYKEGLRERQPN